MGKGVKAAKKPKIQPQSRTRKKEPDKVKKKMSRTHTLPTVSATVKRLEGEVKTLTTTNQGLAREVARI